MKLQPDKINLPLALTGATDIVLAKESLPIGSGDSILNPSSARYQSGRFCVTPSQAQLKMFLEQDGPSSSGPARTAGVIDSWKSPFGNVFLAIHSKTIKIDDMGCIGLVDTLTAIDKGGFISPREYYAQGRLAEVERYKKLLSCVPSDTPVFVLMTTASDQEVGTINQMASFVSSRDKLLDIPLIFEFNNQIHIFLNGEPLPLRLASGE